MTITMTRDNETVTIEGDDELIRESLSYQGTFERQVKLVTQGFYGTPETLKETR